MIVKNWQGLNISIIRDGPNYLATCEEILVHGIGPTEEEAFQDFKDSIFELKDDLALDLQLSDMWKNIKDKLNKISY